MAFEDSLNRSLLALKESLNLVTSARREPEKRFQVPPHLIYGDFVRFESSNIDFIGCLARFSWNCQTGHVKTNRTFLPANNLRKTLIFRLFPALSGYFRLPDNITVDSNKNLQGLVAHRGIEPLFQP